MEKLLINESECIGCDLCVELCPDLFSVGKFVPNIIDKDVTNIQCAKDVVGFCPTNAISII
jgi:ferredoxin